MVGLLKRPFLKKGLFGAAFAVLERRSVPNSGFQTRAPPFKQLPGSAPRFHTMRRMPRAPVQSQVSKGALVHFGPIRRRKAQSTAWTRVYQCGTYRKRISKRSSKRRTSELKWHPARVAARRCSSAATILEYGVAMSSTNLPDGLVGLNLARNGALWPHLPKTTFKETAFQRHFNGSQRNVECVRVEVGVALRVRR
ncbi:hypothetical protein M885DRAFT_32963 [Pelagophyceae sp. CCMP2097]|nr:hypothetical protein M885DRAFT_32963 [Pelagophyceae sp. CCMP2097]